MQDGSAARDLVARYSIGAIKELFQNLGESTVVRMRFSPFPHFSSCYIDTFLHSDKELIAISPKADGS